MSMFRVMSYGSTSYFRRTKKAAIDAAEGVMQQNGCGCIQERQTNGLWKITARFEPWYGIVPA